MGKRVHTVGYLVPFLLIVLASCVHYDAVRISERGTLPLSAVPVEWDTTTGLRFQVWGCAPLHHSIRGRVPSPHLADEDDVFAIDTVPGGDWDELYPSPANTRSLLNTKWSIPVVQAGGGVEVPIFEDVRLGFQLDGAVGEGWTSSMLTATISMQERWQGVPFRFDLGTFLRFRHIDAVYAHAFTEEYGYRFVSIRALRGTSSSSGVFADIAGIIQLDDQTTALLLSPSLYIHFLIGHAADEERSSPIAAFPSGLEGTASGPSMSGISGGDEQTIRETFMHLGLTIMVRIRMSADVSLLAGVRVMATPGLQRASPGVVLAPAFQIVF